MLLKKLKLDTGSRIILRGDIDMKVISWSLLTTFKEYCKFGFVGHHYKFFVTEFLPEVIIHSKKMDEATILSHYDDQNDIFRWFLGKEWYIHLDTTKQVMRH